MAIPASSQREIANSNTFFFIAALLVFIFQDKVLDDETAETDSLTGISFITSRSGVSCQIKKGGASFEEGFILSGILSQVTFHFAAL